MNDSKDRTPALVDRGILGDGAIGLATIPRYVLHDAGGKVIYESDDYLDVVTAAGSRSEH